MSFKQREINGPVNLSNARVKNDFSFASSEVLQKYIPTQKEVIGTYRPTRNPPFHLIIYTVLTRKG